MQVVAFLFAVLMVVTIVFAARGGVAVFAAMVALTRARAPGQTAAVTD